MNLSHHLRSAMRAHVWAMNRVHLESLAAKAAAFQSDLPPATLLAAQTDASRPGPGYEVRDGVAIIEIEGLILKEVPWIFSLSDCAATGTLAVREQLADALDDAAVTSIILYVDSPGGTVDGVQELADDVWAARKIKPVHAILSDLGASAAYWIAAQAETLSANLSANVGSIGVYMILDDTSEAYKAAGIKSHLLASGPHKGTGVAGVPITDEQLRPLQEQVDELADVFVRAVARGRGLDVEAVREQATGRTWQAPKARRLGLIDLVEHDRETFERVASGKPSAAAEATAAQTEAERERRARLVNALGPKLGRTAAGMKPVRQRPAFPQKD